MMYTFLPVFLNSVCSKYAAAAYLEQTEFKKTGKKVYIIGEVGIEEELDLIGVPYIGAGKDSDKAPNMKPGAWHGVLCLRVAAMASRRAYVYYPARAPSTPSRGDPLDAGVPLDAIEATRRRR